MPNTHTTLTSLFSDIADSIRAKTGSSADIVADTFPTAIAAIPSGGKTEAESKDINFYDYDGFRCASWTLAELTNKTALPDAPDHTTGEVPLTSKGWNWTLANLKTLNRQMNVGQMYDTSDGAIHIIADISDTARNPVVGIGINGSAIIDWGDSSTDSISGTTIGVRIDTAHTYASGGRYHIKITPASGTALRVSGDTTNGSYLMWSGVSDNANRKYKNAVRELYFPKGISIVSTALYNLSNLVRLILPSDTTSIGGRLLYNGYALPYVTVPIDVTSIDQYAFTNDYALKTISLPKGLTTIGNYAFQNSNIMSITMPPDVTSIGSSAFSNAGLLVEIDVPSATTSIAANAFSTCLGLGAIRFQPSIPPTVANINAWANLPTDCKILVPYSADHSVLNAYKTAANYPDPTVYTYEEY